MKKIDLGQAFGILANIGVIAGIVFLVIEINQSNTLAQAQTRNEISQSLTNLILAGLEVDFFELELKARDNPSALTETEALKLGAVYGAIFRTYENMHYQYRMGLFDAAEFNAERQAWEGLFERPGARGTWCSSREYYSPAFRVEMDSILPPSGCSGLQSPEER
jgi:hypothetical protein